MTTAAEPEHSSANLAAATLGGAGRGRSSRRRGPAALSADAGAGVDSWLEDRPDGLQAFGASLAGGDVLSA